MLTTTQTQYDAAGRVLSTVYNDGTPNRIFAYDLPQNWTNFTQLNLKGRMVIAHSDGGNFGNNYGATTFSYDAMGRTAKQDECLPGFCGQPSADHMLSYTYGYAGNVISASNGTGTTVGYAYTPAGETTSISFWQTDPTHPYTLLSNVTNGPFGPSLFQYGSGLNGVRSYNSLGRLAGGWACNGSTGANCSGGTQLYGFTVTPQGSRVNQACDSKLGNCATMGYDDLNRLTARTTTSGTTSNNTWSYDRYGNRWSQMATLGGNGTVSYNTANNRENGFNYDAAGNMTSDGLHSYAYDAEGNVTQVDGGQTATYTYDAMNRRVRTVAGGLTSEFVFNQGGQRVSTWNGANGALMEEKVYWGSLPLGVSIGGALYYEHQDWLGTERLRTTASGAIAGSYASGPFGDSLTTTGADGDPYHFAMLDHDSESGLEHAQFRGYSSSQGHWMSPDPYAGSYDWSSPQSLNRYSYVGNNPQTLIDPTGLEPRCVTTTTRDPRDGSVIETSSACKDDDPGSWDPTGIADGLADFGSWFAGLFGGVPSFDGSLKPRANAPNNPDNPNSPESCAEKLAKIDNLVNATRTNNNPSGFKGLAQRFRQMNRPGYDDAGHMEQIANRQAQLSSAIDDYKSSGCGDPPSSAAAYATQPIANPWPRDSSTLKYGVTVVGGSIIVGGIVILCPECLFAAPAFAF